MTIIKRIYKKTNSILEDINKELVSPDDIKYCIPKVLMTKYYAVVKNPLSPKKEVSIDLSAILSLTDLSTKDTSTWDKLELLLTDKIVIGYMSSDVNFNNGDRSLKAVNILNDYDFEFSYGLFTSPTERNIKARRYRLIDAIITKVNEENDINFNNSILSVNGLISTPKVYKDELYSINGALFAHASTEYRLPSILLMDFTNLGGMTIVPFSECKVRNVSGSGTFQSKITPGMDIEFYLPDYVNLYESTLFPVVAYSMFFPDSVHITGKQSVMMQPYALPIYNSLLKLYSASNNYQSASSIIKTDETVYEYVTTSMLEKNHPGGFFIVVNSPTVYIRKTHATNYVWNMATGPKEVNGALFDQTTNSFVDRIRSPFVSATDIYTEKAFDIYPLYQENCFEKPCYSIEEMKCVHQDFTKNLSDNDYYMVEMTR